MGLGSYASTCISSALQSSKRCVCMARKTMQASITIQLRALHPSTSNRTRHRAPPCTTMWKQVSKERPSSPSFDPFSNSFATAPNNPSCHAKSPKAVPLPANTCIALIVSYHGQSDYWLFIDSSAASDFMLDYSGHTTGDRRSTTIYTSLFYIKTILNINRYTTYIHTCIHTTTEIDARITHHHLHLTPPRQHQHPSAEYITSHPHLTLAMTCRMSILGPP